MRGEVGPALAAYLRGERTLEDAVALTRRNTRRYAKRQLTWFRKMEGFRWFPAGDIDGMAAFVRKEMGA